MIESAKNGGSITSRERAELLAAVAMFGDTEPGRASLLSRGDEAALKATALSGIETLPLFLKKSHTTQLSFIVFCVLQGSAEYIGFNQVYTEPAALPAKPQAYIAAMLDQMHAGLGAGFGPVSIYNVMVVTKGNDVYGYIVNSSFPQLNTQSTEECTSIVGARLDFFKTIYQQLEEPEPD